MKFTILLAQCLLFCSCATIRFVNQDRNLFSEEKDFIIVDRIHHIGLFGLYEYSKPVSTKKICENKNFLYVETEHSLVTWAISVILPWIPFLGQVAKMVYSPVSVTVACPDISESEYISQKTIKKNTVQ
ncbi:MAG: hypothetical protein OXB86_03670 [Bdellovibrionales bacterium]|nr:hypothetical protein [Bdellovibrionales bacterium]